MQGDRSLWFNGEPGVDAVGPSRRDVASAACTTELDRRTRAERGLGHARSAAGRVGSALVTVDTSGGDPAGAGFGAHLLATEFLDDVAEAEPEHTDGDGSTLAGDLVVDGDLDLVRLVDMDLKILVPAVGARGVCSGAWGVLDLDVDDGFGRVL